MEIILATHNAHKAEEFSKILPAFIQVKTLSDIGFHEDIEETGETFEDNALLKAKTIYEKTGKPVIADDSGLIVHSLGGAPGVYSARYAGTGNSLDNIHKLLKELELREDRSAYFIAVICFYDESGPKYFEGRSYGAITSEIRGKDGFGYDPVFLPNGFDKTFAELKTEEKNAISHRARAIEKLVEYLKG